MLIRVSLVRYVFMTVTNEAVFWDMTMSCGSCENRHFGGTYRLHLKGERQSPWFATKVYFMMDGKESFLHQ
jgi:hypothetical protein